MEITTKDRVLRLLDNRENLVQRIYWSIYDHFVEEEKINKAGNAYWAALLPRVREIVYKKIVIYEKILKETSEKPYKPIASSRIHLCPIVKENILHNIINHCSHIVNIGDEVFSDILFFSKLKRNQQKVRLVYLQLLRLTRTHHTCGFPELPVLYIPLMEILGDEGEFLVRMITPTQFRMVLLWLFEDYLRSIDYCIGANLHLYKSWNDVHTAGTLVVDLKNLTRSVMGNYATYLCVSTLRDLINCYAPIFIDHVIICNVNEAQECQWQALRMLFHRADHPKIDAYARKKQGKNSVSFPPICARTTILNGTMKLNTLVQPYCRQGSHRLGNFQSYNELNSRIGGKGGGGNRIWEMNLARFLNPTAMFDWTPFNNSSENIVTTFLNRMELINLKEEFENLGKEDIIFKKKTQLGGFAHCLISPEHLHKWIETAVKLEQHIEHISNNQKINSLKNSEEIIINSIDDYELLDGETLLADSLQNAVVDFLKGNKNIKEILNNNNNNNNIKKEEKNKNQKNLNDSFKPIGLRFIQADDMKSKRLRRTSDTRCESAALGRTSFDRPSTRNLSISHYSKKQHETFPIEAVHRSSTTDPTPSQTRRVSRQSLVFFS